MKSPKSKTHVDRNQTMPTQVLYRYSPHPHSIYICSATCSTYKVVGPYDKWILLTQCHTHLPHPFTTPMDGLVFRCFLRPWHRIPKNNCSSHPFDVWCSNHFYLKSQHGGIGLSVVYTPTICESKIHVQNLLKQISYPWWYFLFNFWYQL